MRYRFHDKGYWFTIKTSEILLEAFNLARPRMVPYRLLRIPTLVALGLSVGNEPWLLWTVSPDLAKYKLGDSS